MLNFVSIPFRGDVIGKSSLLETLLGEGLRPPNRRISEKSSKIFSKASILQPENLTV